MGASLLLPRLVSQEYATWLLLTGAIITGTEAQKKGLVLATADKVWSSIVIDYLFLICVCSCAGESARGCF